MRLKELIKRLTKIYEEEGDIKVAIPVEGYAGMNEWITEVQALTLIEDHTKESTRINKNYKGKILQLEYCD